MAEAATTRTKPYKLTPPLTRDSVCTWDYNQRAFCRQNKGWRRFLPPTGGNKTWVAGGVDPTYGIKEEKEDGSDDPEATAETIASLEDFLTCMATYSPPNFFSTVMYEATSFTWILEKINETFNLKTRGEHFLRGGEIKIEYGSDGSTYGQGWMQFKDFYTATMLKAGDIYQGKPMPDKETLSPLATNFIIKEWLTSIDPRLPAHIIRTKGGMFTAEKPTLSCNLQLITDQIPTMLAELEANDVSNININRLSFSGGGYRSSFPSRGGGGGGGGGGGRGRGYRPPLSYPSPVAQQARPVRRCPDDTCFTCFGAGLSGPRAKNHQAKDCPLNQPRRAPPPPRVLLIQTPTGPQLVQACNVQQLDLPGDSVYGQQLQLHHQDSAYGKDYQQETASQGDSYDDRFSEIPVDEYNTMLNKDVNQYPMPITLNLIPTAKIQQFVFSYKGRIAILSIDSGAEGDCIKEEAALRLGITILPLNDTDIIPRLADGSTSLIVVGKAIAQFERDKNPKGIKVDFHGYVVQNLSKDILCGVPFIKRNKVIQNIPERKMSVNGRVIIEEPSFCPSPLFNFDINEQSLKTDTEPKSDLAQKQFKLIEIGPEVPKAARERLNAIHSHHRAVFDKNLSEGYNGASGNFDVDFCWLNNKPPSPHLGSVPTYTKKEDHVLLQAMIDRLEKQNIVAKANDIGVIPKYANPCMLVKKNDAKTMTQGEYAALSIPEKLDENRFVLCQNKLCAHIMKKPAVMSRLEDAIQEVGASKFNICSDLTNSFWQRWIVEDKLPYFAFHGPYGQDYIFLRSSQGLLNQSEELEQLVKVILQELIQEGWCRVHADNLWVSGDTMEETIERWRRALEALERNNIKLSAKKTKCFPASLDLLGWKKEGELLIPDPHRINTLKTAARPETITELRSYLGAYNTFHKCTENAASLLKDLHKLCGTDRKKKAKISWTPELTAKFQKSQEMASQFDSLYIPKPEDQLVLTCDYCEKSRNLDTGGISATLWAMRDGHTKPDLVMRMSAPIGPQQKDLKPCDGEALASYVAARSPQFSVPIKATSKKVIALVDNKTVYEAAKLLSNGRFSSSKPINNILAGISELNLEYQHVSGKMGRNFPDDFSSRNPAVCSNPSDCSTCKFVADCSMIISEISMVATEGHELCIIGSINPPDRDTFIKDIISGKTSLPLSNRSAIKFLQDQDQDLRRVRQLLLAGQNPSLKRDFKPVKNYFRQDVDASVDSDGCVIVTRTSRKYIGAKQKLLVIPDSVSLGLLTSLYIHLRHPTEHQLKLIVQSRFYVRDLARMIKDIKDSCTLCTSLQTVPKEAFSYQPGAVPEHPGEMFTIDIVKEQKKVIMATVCNFSGYLSTTMLASEKTEDLIDGVVITVTPFMASTNGTRIRVDQAPGWSSLFGQKDKLATLGIDLQLGFAKNKNSLAVCDERIRELRKALRVETAAAPLSVRTLARATATVNERIRNHSLTPKEILFSRDKNTNKNIDIRDETIADTVKENRKVHNLANAAATARIRKKPEPAGAVPGQLVFIKNELSKSSGRELYMVLEAKKDNTALITKIKNTFSDKPMSMQPKRYTYIVSQECLILSPNQPKPLAHYEARDQEHPPNHPSPSLPVPRPPPEVHQPSSKPLPVDHGTAHPNTWYVQEHDGDPDPDEDRAAPHVEVAMLIDIEDAEAAPPPPPPPPIPPEEVVPLLIDNQQHDVGDDQQHDVGDDQQHDVEDNQQHDNDKQLDDGDEQLEDDGDLIQVPAHLQPLDQHRQPRKGDIVSYYKVETNTWPRARVTARTNFRHYYNIRHIDDTLPAADGVYLEPSTDDNTFCWTLLPPEARPVPQLQQLDADGEGRREEQLRSGQQPPSRQVSPSLPDDRQFPPGTLTATPDQLLQPGAVYHVPELPAEDEVQVSTSHTDAKRQERWNRVYTEKYNSLQLIPEQEYMCHALAANAADDAYYVHQRDKRRRSRFNPFHRH